MDESQDQKGFTLIELLVVVALIAILLSVALISIKPSESAVLRKASQQVKGALISMCDQAAFDQHIYQLLPDEKGLTVLVYQQKEWQESDRFKPYQWPESVNASWQQGQILASLNGEIIVGWMCWPSGEVTAGKVVLKMNDTEKVVEWNGVLKFEAS